VAESDKEGTAAPVLREIRVANEVVVRDLEAVVLAVTDTVRGTPRRAGMERVMDRQAAMMNCVEGKTTGEIQRQDKSQTKKRNEKTIGSSGIIYLRLPQARGQPP
jgi:hypothetical protein